MVDNEKTESLNEKAKRAGAIAMNANLLAINLRGLEVGIVDETDLQPEKLLNEYRVEHRLVRGEEQNKLVVYAHFDVRVVSSGEGKVLFSVKSKFRLDYSLNRGMPESVVNDLGAFAETNSLIHVWPYYRELFQSMTWRMGLPPFPLPLFRIRGNEEQAVGDSKP